MTWTLCIVLPTCLWGMGALWFQVTGGTMARCAAVTVWLLFALTMVVAAASGHPRLAPASFLAAFALLLVWWLRIEPSNDRPWADDVAHTATGELQGERVVLHNVRNFDWRTTTDYTPRWETRTYDLNLLNSVDMILSYWTIEAIAHVLISFGFEDGARVVFSVEIRREKTERFSALGGFFKQFELSVIASDERDVIRVRTNVRGEDGYLYRVRMPSAHMRSLFLAYIGQANELARKPRFYNTITVNCTTLVFQMMKRIIGHLPLDIRLLLSGYLPGYVYRVGGLDSRYSLQELRAFGLITDRARQSDRGDRFSADIRMGIPLLAALEAAEPVRSPSTS